MKKVLLVNPWIYDFAAYDYWLKPVGLLYIAALLHEYGVETVLLDLLDRNSKKLEEFLGTKPKNRFYGTGKFHVEELEKPEVVKNIPRIYKRYGFPIDLARRMLEEFSQEDFNAIFVTSTLTYWYPGVWDTIKLIKEYFPRTPLVLGGIYTALFPDHAKKSRANFVVGSTSMKDSIKVIKQAIKIDIPKELEENWFQILSPRYELYDRLDYAVLLTSLGCPFRCTYCAAWKLQPNFVVKNPRFLVDYIKKLALRGVKDIVFFDDAILVAKEKFTELLELIIAKGLNFLRYHLPNGLHASLVDEKVAKLLKDANFKTVILAVETLDMELQKRTSNKLVSSDFYRAVEILKGVGFSEELKVYLLINMPGQTMKSVLNSMQICNRLGLRIYLNEYTPIPLTRDWEELIRRGFLSEDIDPLLLNNKVLPHWFKAGMDHSTIEKLKQIAKDMNNNLRKKREVQF